MVTAGGAASAALVLAAVLNAATIAQVGGAGGVRNSERYGVFDEVPGGRYTAARRGAFKEAWQQDHDTSVAPGRTSKLRPDNKVRYLHAVIQTTRPCAKTHFNREKRGAIDCRQHCRKICEPYYGPCGCKAKNCYQFYCRLSRKQWGKWDQYQAGTCTCKCDSCRAIQ